MSSLQPPRGTRDILPEESRALRHIEATAREVAARYGYGEIMPPMFEFSEVFHRTLGETSDVVSKETYCFADRAGDSLTLRPEFTASVVRAFISNGLQQLLPLKLFYCGSAFRYERPQKGRYREFRQFGVEWLGSDSPAHDVETIALAMQLLQALGVHAHITLEVNSLGDTESRGHYRDRLVAYLQDHKDDLSEDSQKRLERNPMRILDSKDEGDRKIIAAAPEIAHSFTAEAAEYFAAVREGLEELGIAYTINPNLVRGLDYYCHTVFECTTEALGAQNTVLAGGRYDGLAELMGGRPTPGIGWAAGLERLATLAAAPPPAPRPVAIVAIDQASEALRLLLAYKLRQAGVYVEAAYSGNVGKQLKKAGKDNAVAAVMLGEEERQNDTATVKWLDSGEQETVEQERLAECLQAKLPES